MSNNDDENVDNDYVHDDEGMMMVMTMMNAGGDD